MKRGVLISVTAGFMGLSTLLCPVHGHAQGVTRKDTQKPATNAPGAPPPAPAVAPVVAKNAGGNGIPGAGAGNNAGAGSGPGNNAGAGPGNNAGAGNNAGTAGKPSAVKPLELTLSGEGQRVRVLLPKMPPTRTRCSFDASDGTDSVTFEWDPLSPRGLAREATLAKGKYHVSCSTEAARHAIQHETNYAWTFHRGAWTDQDPKKGGTLAFCDPAVSGPTKLCTETDAQTLATVTVEDRRQLAGATGRNLLTSAPGLPVLGPAPRAFGALSDEALNEAFQVIAEVVVEQAKSKGMKLVTAKLTALLCDTLVIDKKLPALPRTCDAVRSIRLEDLTSTGRQLLDAFVEDLVRATLGAALDAPCKTEQLGTSCDKLVKIALDAAVSAALGREEKLRSAGHRVLFAMMDVMAESGRPELQLAGRIVQECSGAPCDAARIQRMIADPAGYFNLGVVNADNLRTKVKEWPEMSAFVSSALRLASPSASVTETAQLRAAIELLFDVVERVADVKPGSYTTVANSDSVQKPTKKEEWIPLARQLLLGAVERDLGKLAVPATRMLRSQLPNDVPDWDLRVVARLGGALGSFMSTSVTGRAPTKEELEERRKAKKEAVKSLIESQTERRIRLGDRPILSLGSSVGFLAGGHESGTFPAANPADPPIVVGERFHAQPVVTLGLALDYHARDRFGFHLELAPINLGSYATVLSESPDGDAVAPPSPGDALSPSVTAGMTYLFTDADLIFLFGAQAGYSAKVGEPVQTGTAKPEAYSYRGFYLGAVIGAYIPIFDFN
jgi:hypothetical protein